MAVRAVGARVTRHSRSAEVARSLHDAARMHSYIDISFIDARRDRALEGAIHRWVARVEGMGFDVRGATIRVEPHGRKALAVQVALTLANGVSATGNGAHVEPFVAISDAFRVVSRALRQRGKRTVNALIVC